MKAAHKCAAHFVHSTFCGLDISGWLAGCFRGRLLRRRINSLHSHECASVFLCHMYIHMKEETLMAQRQITSAFKLGRECYLNNSFRGPVPSRAAERDGCCGDERERETEHGLASVRPHKINNKLCHLNLLITSRQPLNFLINGGRLQHIHPNALNEMSFTGVSNSTALI